MSYELVELSGLMAKSSGSVNPAKFPIEEFELFSIPAFDAGVADIKRGEEIGSSKQCVEPGDVLLSKIVPHIRRSWIVGPTNGRRQIASSEWIVFRSKRVHTNFLRQLLVGDMFHAMFMNTVAGVGGSLLRARPSHVAKIRIPLPPLSEQKRIAEILDRAESLRCQRRAALALLDELTQSIFLDMFGNPIANDRNWPIGKLQDVCRVDRGKFTPRPRNDPIYYGGKFPFIQTGDISSCGGRLRAWTQTLNEKGVSVSRKFAPGTVVIAIVGATLGITGILETEVYCPDSVVGIVPNEGKSTSEYIDRILRWWRPIFVSQAPETARANINLETLRPLCIPLAPFSLQQKYSTLVVEIEILKAKQIRGMDQLDALFASLQHRAFRGEL